MRKTILPFLFLSVCYIAQAQVHTVPVEKLLEAMHQKSAEEELRVVNFWATWCKPCVKEMPYFQALKRKYEKKGLRLILVSLDSQKDAQAIEAYLQKRNWSYHAAFLLNDSDQNAMINAIDKRWDGTLPTTFLIQGKTGQKIGFYAQSFHSEEELMATISPFLKK